MEASGRLLLKEVLDEFGACLASCSKDGIRSRRDRARILSVRGDGAPQPSVSKGATGVVQRRNGQSCCSYVPPGPHALGR